MKKAALRRVIIYVLVFSLTYTSVSAAIVRPVEVQAIVGADDAALAILLALLAAGGYYASSSAAAANIKTEFLSFVGKISGTASTSTEATADIIKNTVVYSGFIDLGYNSTQAFEASKHFLAATSLIEFGYTDDTDRTWSVTADGDKFVISDTIGNVSWSCTIPSFKVNSILPKNLNINLLVSEGKIPQDDPEAAAIAVGLLAELKRLVNGFIKNMTKEYAKNKAMVNNSKVSSIKSADETNSVRDNIMLYLTDINSKYFKSSYTSNSYHPPLTLKKYLVTNNIKFADIYNEQSLVFPSNFITIYEFKQDNSTYGWLKLYFTEDLSGYDLVLDGSTLYKYDSAGNSSSVLYNLFAYARNDAVQLSNDFTPKNVLNVLRYGFDEYCSVQYSNGCNQYYSFQLSSIDLSKYYTSLDNYINHVSYYDEAKQYIFYGSSDYAASDNSDVYVPDGTTYDKLVENIEANAANAEKLAAALAAAQAANAKALEDMKDSIEEGNATTASLLQKILNALNALNTSVTTHLPLDVSSVINSFAGTADVIGDIDKLLNQKLPVIGSMADVVAGSLPAIDDIKDWAEKVAGPSIDNLSKTGEEAVKSIDELGDNILAKLAPIDLLTNLDGTVDGIASDALNLNKLITGTIAGDTAISVSVDDSKPIAVTVAPSVSEPTDQDGFNLGFFNILYLLFLILFKIIMIFCHCLELLFTIHSVTAYPYFINNDMIRGLNWIKSVNITGGLLNISLYDFLFALVRIILVFSVIRLIRHYTDRL